MRQKILGAKLNALLGGKNKQPAINKSYLLTIELLLPGMSKPELVLSNTTTFFSGNIESVFRKAKKHGFKFLEILPYRWTTPEQILRLTKKYDIQIAGIHMPEWWNMPLLEVVKRKGGILQKILTFVWNIYLGAGVKNSGLKIAEAVGQNQQNYSPYVLFHPNLVLEMGDAFDPITKRFHTVVENLPYHKNDNVTDFHWNPVTIQRNMQKRGLATGIVLDAGHFMQTIERQPKLGLNIIQTYQQIRPEIVHISYNNGALHTLPNEKEQADLIQMLRIHSSRYIVIETNPLINAGSAKTLLDEIIQASKA